MGTRLALEYRSQGRVVAAVEQDAGSKNIDKEDEILILAKMKHNRWCAERWLAGWRYGDRTDRENKINRDLVTWDKLDQPERDKEPEQIRDIPRALKKVGRWIFRYN